MCVMCLIIVCLVSTGVCIVLWCGVFSWAEHEVQHWQCVLSTAPPLDFVVMWLLIPYNRWMWGGPCLICLLCVCVYLVWWTCCVYMHGLVLHWSVCRCEFHPITHTPVIGINIYRMLLTVSSLQLYIMFTDSHSHFPSDWTSFTPSTFAPCDTSPRWPTSHSHTDTPT